MYVIQKIKDKVTAFVEWEDTPENEAVLKDWEKWSFKKAKNKYVMAYDGNFYKEGEAPEKPVDMVKDEKRKERNRMLEMYVDPVVSNALRWNSLTQEEQNIYLSYRKYLLDFTEAENWWLEPLKTLGEFKNVLG